MGVTPGQLRGLRSSRFMKLSIGRYIFGLSAIGFGISNFVWRDFVGSDFLKVYHVPHLEILAYIVGIVQILGGVAVLWPGTQRLGAVALGAVYLFLSLLALPFIIRHPLVFNGWGNFFEVFSLVSAAAILYAWSGPVAPARAATIARFGYYSFGLAVISFALEQAFYFSPPVSLVPKWIPPGQIFWALATTVAFGLAGIALLTGFLARLASQLNTAMLLGFGLLVWVPILVADPRNFSNWSEGLETLAIAAAAWIVTEYLSVKASPRTL
jgi:uncharacterized membrane protein YphA (DoxX/SURF4 family)